MAPQTISRTVAFVLPLILFFLLFLGLGRWQLERMQEKQALFAEFESGAVITLPLSQVDAAAARYQHVIATGHYDTGRQILLDNMTHAGSAGYRVLTVLRASGRLPVLVDRGWVAAGATRQMLPDVAVTEELRGVAGRLDSPPRAGINLPAREGKDWPRVMSYPTIGELEAVLGEGVFPHILLLDADQPDGYVREWRPSTFPPERHLAYAVTWFALAAAVLVGFVALFLHRRNQ